MRHVGVDEVGSGFGATHGAGGSVIGQGSFLGGVEGSEPMPFLGGRVSYFGGVSAPRPPPHSEEPRLLLLLLLLLRLLLLRFLLGL